MIMATAGTVFQKGGGGTNFEQYIQAALVATLLVKGGFPGLPENEVQEIVFQSSNYGWQTDDILVKARSKNITHQVLIQSKHNLVFSSENEVFVEVIAAFWKDYNNENFAKVNDRLIIAKSSLNNIEKNHVKTILNYAKTHSSAEDFFSEINLVQEKQKKLNVFKDTVKLVNENREPSNEELWSFLKCVDLIGFDFLNQTSTDETYFLNLIRLTRSSDVVKSDKDIWNSIVNFAVKTNPSGGSLTQDNIVQQEFYQYFNVTRLDTAYKAINKLNQDSGMFLSSISNSIGINPELHISRTESIEKILHLIDNFSFCIVTGRPGVGKSAIVRELLTVQFKDHMRIIFRADQLNRSTLAIALSEIGIQDSLVDVFSCLCLNANRIIFIDSLEKLLEDADSTSAFKQLFLLAKKNSIKIVATARKYAVELILQKFDISFQQTGIFELPVLTESELHQVADVHNVLQQPLKNNNIRQLLQTPKYLDFTLKSLSHTPDDLDFVTITQFKDKLWKSLVRNEGYRVRGLPAKREKAFMNIAVTRAIEMKLFSNVTEEDEEVLDLLENDDIIIHDGRGRYAPTHDILEDWALIKYVEHRYTDLLVTESFFRELGNEPAIRRAFRLWVEDFVRDDFKKIIPLIHLCIESIEIENYWRDELLTAVFNSDTDMTFFTVFQDKLLEVDGKLLNDCLMLIRTSCRERSNFSDQEVLLPIGSGWKAALLFISEHLNKVNSSRPAILRFLYHYDYRLLFQYPKDKQELTAIKDIALFYISQIVDVDKFWDNDESTSNQDLIVDLLFATVPVAKEHIIELVKAAFKNEEDNNWGLSSFYEKVLEKFLGGLRSQRLALFLSDFLIESAWQHWKYVPPAKHEISDYSQYYHYQSPWLDSPQCWGIEDKNAFFPSGVYKTPLSNILAYWPEKGIKFIVDFLNYSVDFYVESKCAHKHALSEMNLTMNDGSIVKQWGSWEFWVAYRGLSVTHYLLECLLMTLETFLLDFSGKEDEKSKSDFKKYFAYVLRNSNSVMPTGVLVSIAIANPKAVGEELLPLVSFREMYVWEAKRPLAEYGATAIFDQKIGFAQNERSKSNKLSHRTKYRRGFGDLLVDYQLTIGIINQQLRAIFDRLWQEADLKDILWRKKLNEIDTRNWTASEVQGELGRFVIQPTYDPSVESYVASNRNAAEAVERASEISMDLFQVLTDGKILEQSKWEEYLLYFTNLEKSDYQENRPATFAVISLEKFGDSLNEKETEWCITILSEAIWTVIAQNRTDIEVAVSFNILERDIALNSFSTLKNILSNDEDIDGLIFLICYTFISLPNYLLRDFAPEYRSRFAANNPDIAKRVWKILLKLAQFRTDNRSNKLHAYFVDQNNEGLKEYNFLLDLCKDENKIQINVTSLSFENSDANTVLLALLTIQNSTFDEELFSFIESVISLIDNDLREKEHLTRRHKRRRFQREIDHHILFYVEVFFAELLLNVDRSKAEKILESIVKTVSKTKKSELHGSVDVFKFANSVLCWLIYKIDDISNGNIQEDQKVAYMNRFWFLWKHLFNLISKSQKFYLTAILLLDTEIPWETDRNQSRFLEGRSDLYKLFVDKYGSTNFKSLIKFLSTVGRKEFLLDGLSWITEILIAKPGQVMELDMGDSERIAKYLLVNHMPVIKNNQLLINRFLFFLDKLIELGSSSAYLIRENVMTYKIYSATSK